MKKIFIIRVHGIRDDLDYHGIGLKVFNTYLFIYREIKIQFKRSILFYNIYSNNWIILSQ